VRSANPQERMNCVKQTHLASHLHVFFYPPFLLSKKCWEFYPQKRYRRKCEQGMKWVSDGRWRTRRPDGMEVLFCSLFFLPVWLSGVSVFLFMEGFALDQQGASRMSPAQHSQSCTLVCVLSPFGYSYRDPVRGEEPWTEEQSRME
jgi:hypothetical protein